MKILIRVALVVAVCVPSITLAQSNDSVTAQAQALLDQVQKMQQQLGVAGSDSTTQNTPITTTRSLSDCPQVGYTLKLGMSTPDVTRLQQFLALDPAIYPEGKITGYYGSLTQTAVQRWQKKYDIVTSGTPETTGYGVFGPKTAAAVALQCAKLISSGGGGGTGVGAGSSDVVGGFIKVSPISGASPLTVTVDATVNSVRSCAGALYTLDWGDGSPAQSIPVAAQQCNSLAHTFTHVYSKVGGYAISLSSGKHESISNVTVTGTSASTSSGSGNAPADTSSSASTGGTNDTSATGSGNSTISMSNMQFSPKTLTVTSGTKVTWTNNDSTTHTVSADNGSYNSGPLAPGQSYSLTFTIPGEYTYFCALHGAPGGSGMSAKIIVQ